MIDIGAVVMSVGEPQLDRCLASVACQDTSGFSQIIHVDGVSPQAAAYNKALSRVESDWALWLGGDMILYPDALRTIGEYVGFKPPDPHVYQYQFGLMDTFLGKQVCCCALRRTRAFKQADIEDCIGNDVKLAAKLEGMGWSRHKPSREGIDVGTHFDKPDDFQVFRRFMVRGAKASGKPRVERKMKQLLLSRYKETGDKQYQIALDAIGIGLRNGYNTGHDIRRDREEYRNWLIATA